MTNLETNNLVVGWPERPVLNFGSHSFSDKEITVIAGPNGSGKSTLLKTIARQIHAHSGSTTLDGTEIWQLGARRFAQLVSYVPQLIEPPREMTVEELVALGRSPHQKWWSWETSSQDQDAINNAIINTGVEHLRNKRLVDLSGGERQRATIAGALAQQAKIILLDEPTAHLDFKHQLRLVELVKDLKNSSIGAVLVLHDLNLMARIADRIILLDAKDSISKVAACGAPADVLTKSMLRQVFAVEVTILEDAESGIPLYSPVTALPDRQP